MIASVDTNVLFDVFRTDSPHHYQSLQRLRRAYDGGSVIICDIVYAELVPFFRSRGALDGVLQAMGAVLSPLDSSIEYEAGLRWKRYREAGGPRNRIIADFLIGAHAMVSADAFLTRDRGFFSTYFPELSRSR